MAAFAAGGQGPSARKAATSAFQWDGRGTHMYTILVIDDEPQIRELFRVALTRQGYTVATAPNGSDGLLALEMCLPDLILLDLAMPEMDGIAFLRVLRESEEWARLPVIVLTAFGTPDQLFASQNLGISDRLNKAQFTVRELRERIARCLEPVQMAVA
jgi:DNA-binding response OmpR family regulator